MKTILVPALFFIFVFLLTSCASETSVPPTQIPISTQLPTHIQNQIALPTLVIPPSQTAVPSTSTAYPTANVVNSNSVAFIERDYWTGNPSLWVVNVDGSGEKKLVDIIQNKNWYAQYLQWSPDGRWICYFSNDELWMVSRDGLVNKRLLSLSDKSVGYLIIYAWSPDSSKIAYLETSSDKPTATPTPGPESGISPYIVGMIDVETGKVSELSAFEANAGYPFLLWSKNGYELFFIKDYSLVLFNVPTRKVVKEMKRGCGIERNISLSPNGQWYSYTDNGVGRYFTQWICVGGIDNSLHQIQVDGTTSTPIWDKTGNFLYFVARKTNPDSDPNLKIDEWLMRYDVRTKKVERLLPLREQQTYDYISSVLISPDGNTLTLLSQSSQTKLDLIFVDIQSLILTKSSVDFGPLPVEDYPSNKILGWSPDNKFIIFFFTKLYWINNSYGSVHYGYFYTLDISSGKISVFSGIHRAENTRLSPIFTGP